MARRLLLDTSSLVYRAFFALPATLTDAGGRPVNAVHGYLDMVTRLVRDRPGADGGAGVVHCLDDDWRPAPRVAAYPGYKADRPPDPEGLPRQFAVLDDVLDGLGAARARAPGWEADDVIGVLCATAPPGTATDIVTGDRDLLQLVHDADGDGDARAVRVLFTVRGTSDLAVFDEAAVLARYGVPAHRYVDFAVLRGDPSDGLPGVPGVGEKTARALVTAHGDLDALLRAVDDLPPRLGERLRAATGYLAAMRAVVPVRVDVPVEVASGARDDARLDVLAERHGLRGPLRRLREALDGGAPDGGAPDGQAPGA